MEHSTARAVAIVGAGAILPDAPDVATFWTNITSGRYSVTEVSPERWDPALYFDSDHAAPDKTYSKIGGWVRQAEWNPVKWRLPLPPRVAEAMDEAQKWAIACAVQALGDFGYPARPLDPDRTAVILGNAMAGERHYLTALRASFPEYARVLEASPTFAALPAAARQAITQEWHDRLAGLLPGITEDSMPGELSNCLAGRIANLLNFRGPNFVVDAACASAMAAVRAAAEGLAEHEFDMALSGGIDRNMSAHTFIKFCKIGALSATGSRPYADGADGFVMGEGAVIFLLERLEDAEAAGHNVYAVIRGVGASSDGKGKGITAPNPIGQRLAIERAWRAAGLPPDTATLIEGHGTSTAVGDLVEVQSLIDVLGSAAPRKESVALGSVKSNIGHLKGAAGAAGLLKAALALRDRTIPPNANFERPNPKIAFAQSPFVVPRTARPWDVTGDTPRRAGVSAFGFGGTNFHMVLEEFLPGRSKARSTSQGSITSASPPAAPGSGSASPPSGAAGPKLPLRGCLVIGETTPGHLLHRLERIGAEARNGSAPPIAPPAASDLQADQRLAIDYGTASELADKCARAAKALAADAVPMWKALRAQGIFRGRGPRAKVAFLYPGQGSQYVNMLAALRAREPVVGAVFDEADTATTSLLGTPISTHVFANPTDQSALAAAEEGLRQTAITQPAVLTVDAALTRLLAAYGVVADMVMGHSLGEYAALQAAGALPLADALEAVSARGREMTRVSVADNGLMAAVFAPMEEVERLLRQVEGYVVVANINSAKQAVIGGATEPVTRAVELFRTAGFQVTPLAVSHAFHTRIVAPASGPLRRVLERLRLAPPRVPVVANVTGMFYPSEPGGRAALLDLLEQQIASPVQFVKGLETLFAAGARVFVEVGPKKALHGFAEEAFGQRGDVTCLFTNHPKLDDVVAFNQALCGLYAAGLGAARPDTEGRDRPAPEVRAAERGAPEVRAAERVTAGRRTAEPPAPAVQREGVREMAVQEVTEQEVRVTATVFHDKQESRGAAAPAVPPDRYAEVGRLLAPGLERCLELFGRLRGPAEPVVVSGAAMGLPGGAHVFDDTNVARLLEGERLVGSIPDGTRRAMADKRITRLVKSDTGEPRFDVIEDPREVIKLAARGGTLDLAAEFGVSEDRLAALDRVTQLAIAAGLEALRDAGIPLVLRYKTTTRGTRMPDRWGLPEALRDETGVIFGSAFPGLDSLVSEISRYYMDRLQREKLELLRSLRQLANGNEEDRVRAAIEARMNEVEEQVAREPYLFDRRFLLRTLAMGHSQFAEMIGARGPNTQVNAACATTSHALSLAEDWIREGRCRRVIVVTADDITTDNLLEWFGAGFLASGAAATDERVEDAVLPFDRRRHGLVIGMGAAGVVVESADALRERGVQPICEVLATVSSNSAFHATRLDVQHIAGVMEKLVSDAEARWQIDRRDIAGRTVFVSHETYTPARGGSASAEAAALRRVFGDEAGRIVVANTKGYTGHPMAAGIEEVAAIKMLETGLVPAVANHREPDPELGELNLSRGGEYPVEYALRLGAGFGSQIAMSLMRWVPTGNGVRRAPDALGYRYRVADEDRWQAWLKSIATGESIELEVVSRTLRMKAPARAGTGSRQTPARREEPVGPAAPVSAAETLAPREEEPVRAAETVTPREEEPVRAADPVKTAEMPARAPEDAVPATEARPAAAPAVSEEEIRQAVLALVVEKTGYPAEMLALDLDLEADLGVDTVKQAELLAAIRGRYDIPRDDTLKLRDFPTLAHVINFVRDRVPQPAATVADAMVEAAVTLTSPAAPTLAAPPTRAESVAPVAAPVVGPTISEEDIRQTVLALVVEKTGYPTEMLDLDLDLEADLGVDTVKQAELLAAIRGKYDIPRDDTLKLRDFPTLAHVIHFVRDRLPQPAAATVAVASAASAVASAATAPTEAEADPAAAEPATAPPAGKDPPPRPSSLSAVEASADTPAVLHAAAPTPANGNRTGDNGELACALPLDPPVRPRWVTPRAFEDASLIPRRVPTPVLRPPLAMCKGTGVTLRTGKRVVVMCDEGGTGSLLVGHLRDLGVQCLLVGGSPNQVELAARLHGWLAGGPIHGVYWLPALDPEGEWREMTPEMWQEATYRRIRLLGVTMRALYEQVSRPGTFLVAATRLGGHHGYDAAGATCPLGGAVTGFVKAYKRERPDALVKVVDFGMDAPPETIAARLADETLRDPAAVEIGYRLGERWSVSLTEADGPGTQRPIVLDHRTVFLVTGAAGSIVSAIVGDLASASGGTFYLLDRVPPPDAANPDLARLLVDRDGLKRELVERAKAAGQRPTPATIERELAAIEREQAALSSIQAVEGAGGRAVYLEADLTDAAAVAAAVDKVRAASGRVDVLLHAAGIEISRSLCNKAQQEFDLVFDVKATGFFNLLRAIGNMPVAASVVFSSVAARFGNAGQTDYSAANDLMCKVSSSFRTTRPGTRGIAIDWTAWRDIGMASRGSIPMILEQAGIEMIPPDAGIPILRQHLVEGWPSGEVLVAGRLGLMMAESDVTGGLEVDAVRPAANGHGAGPMLGRVTGMNVHDGLVVETHLDPAAQPFLSDHQIDGVSVLPGAMGVEAFGELATLVLPEWHVAAIEEVRFLAPVKFYKGEPRTLRLQAVFHAEGDGVVASCRLIGRRTLATRSEVQETTHFVARVRLQRHLRQPDRVRVPAAAAPLKVEAPDVYRIYFHGPAYRVLDNAWRADHSVVGRMTGRLPANHVPPGLPTVMAPRLIELAFQTAGIWDLGVNARLSLPHSIDRVTAYTGSEPAARELVALVRPDARENVFDADVVDETGRVYLSVRGYRVIALPGAPDAALLEPLRRAMQASAEESLVTVRAAVAAAAPANHRVTVSA